MLKSSLIYQVWSAWWIRGAGEHRPQCDEIRLQTVQYRLLCIYHGPNRLGSDDKPSKTRRSLIPTLSWSAGILISFFSFYKYCLWKVKYSKSSCTVLIFLQETQKIRSMLAHNMKRAHEVFNSLPGFSCQPVGGAFLFPTVHLPAKAIQKAKVTIHSH